MCWMWWSPTKFVHSDIWPKHSLEPIWHKWGDWIQIQRSEVCPDSSNGCFSKCLFWTEAGNSFSWLLLLFPSGTFLKACSLFRNRRIVSRRRRACKSLPPIRLSKPWYSFFFCILQFLLLYSLRNKESICVLCVSFAVTRYLKLGLLYFGEPVSREFCKVIS